MNTQSSEGSNDHEEGTSSPRTPKKHKFIPAESKEVDSAEGPFDAKGVETHTSDKVATGDEALVETVGGYSNNTGATAAAATATADFDPPVLRKGDLVRLSNE
jgi:hypothetical protein